MKQIGEHKHCVKCQAILDDAREHYRPTAIEGLIVGRYDIRIKNGLCPKCEADVLYDAVHNDRQRVLRETRTQAYKDGYDRRAFCGTYCPICDVTLDGRRCPYCGRRFKG